MHAYYLSLSLTLSHTHKHAHTHSLWESVCVYFWKPHSKFLFPNRERERERERERDLRKGEVAINWRHLTHYWLAKGGVGPGAGSNEGVGPKPIVGLSFRPHKDRRMDDFKTNLEVFSTHSLLFPLFSINNFTRGAFKEVNSPISRKKRVDVCVGERVCVCVFVCVWKWEREVEGEGGRWYCVLEREGDICVCVCVLERDRQEWEREIVSVWKCESVYVCVCVCVVVSH